MWGFDDDGDREDLNFMLQNANEVFFSEPLPPAIATPETSPLDIVQRVEKIAEIPEGESRTALQKNQQKKADAAVKELNEYLKRKRDRELGRNDQRQQALDHEGAMLRGEGAANALKVNQAVRQKYANKLREMGGVDAVLEELENVIIEKLGGDRRYFSDKSKRACKSSDFRVAAVGNDNLTEVGKYKAALRALLDDAPGSHFGNVFHRGSNRKIGTGYGGGDNNAREVLAYMYLAASDPNMALLPGIEESMGREAAVAGEIEGLISSLADIRRAHNDGQYKGYKDTNDDPSCDAGSWGRIFETPVYNKLTNLKYKEDLELRSYSSPAIAFEFKIKSTIVDKFNQLPTSQQFEMLNNWVAVGILQESADNRLGYGVDDFYKDIREDFDGFWQMIVNDSEDLQSIQDTINQLKSEHRNRRDSVTLQYYENVLNAQKNYALHIWCQEMGRLAELRIHEDVYKKMSANVVEQQLAGPRQAMLKDIAKDAKEYKDKLSDIDKALSQLRRQYNTLKAKTPQNMQEAKALQAELDALNKDFAKLQKEKKDTLDIIKNIAQRKAAEYFAESMPEEIKRFIDDPKAVIKAIQPEALVAEKKTKKEIVQPDKTQVKAKTMPPHLVTFVKRMFEARVNPTDEQVEKLSVEAAASEVAEKFSGPSGMSTDEVKNWIMQQEFAKPSASREPEPQVAVEASEPKEPINVPVQEQSVVVQPMHAAPIKMLFGNAIKQRGLSIEEAAEATAQKFYGMVRVSKEALAKWILEQDYAQVTATAGVSTSVEGPNDKSTVPEQSQPTLKKPDAAVLRMIIKEYNILEDNWPHEQLGEKTHQKQIKQAIERTQPSLEKLSEEEVAWLMQFPILLDEALSRTESHESRTPEEAAFLKCVKEAYNNDFGQTERGIQIFLSKAIEIARSENIDIKNPKFPQLAAQYVFFLSAKKRYDNRLDDFLPKIETALESGSLEAAQLVETIREFGLDSEFTKNPRWIKSTIIADRISDAYKIRQFIGKERITLEKTDPGQAEYSEFLNRLENALQPNRRHRVTADEIQQLAMTLKHAIEANSPHALMLLAEITMSAEVVDASGPKYAKSLDSQFNSLFSELRRLNVFAGADPLQASIQSVLKVRDNPNYSDVIRNNATEAANRLLNEFAIQCLDNDLLGLSFAAKNGNLYAQFMIKNNALLEIDSKEMTHLAAYRIAFDTLPPDAEVLTNEMRELASRSGDPKLQQRMQSTEKLFRERQQRTQRAEKILEPYRKVLQQEHEAAEFNAFEFPSDTLAQNYLMAIDILYTDYTGVLGLLRARESDLPSSKYANKSVVNMQDLAIYVLKHYDIFGEQLKAVKPDEHEKVERRLKEEGSSKANPNGLKAYSGARIIFLGAQKRLQEDIRTNSPRDWLLGIEYLKQAEQMGYAEANKLHQQMNKHYQDEALAQLEKLLKAKPETVDAHRALDAFIQSQMALMDLGDKRAELLLRQIALMGSVAIPGLEDETVFKGVKEGVKKYLGPGYFADMVLAIERNIESDVPSIKALAVKVNEALGDYYYQRCQSQNGIDADLALSRAIHLGHQAAIMDGIFQTIQMMIDDPVLHQKKIKLLGLADLKSEEPTSDLYKRAEAMAKSNPELQSGFIKVKKQLGRFYLNKANEAMKKAHNDTTNKSMHLNEVEKNLKLAKAQGHEININLAMERDLRQGLEGLLVNPEWLTELMANMENNEEEMKLDIGVVVSKVQHQRNAFFNKAFKDMLMDDDFAENKEELTKLRQILLEKEKDYYRALQEESDVGKVDNCVRALIDAKTNLQKAKDDLQQKLTDSLEEENLTNVDERYLHSLFHDATVLEELSPFLMENLSNTGKPFFNEILNDIGDIERAVFLEFNHLAKKDFAAESKQELLHDIDEFLKRIKDIADVLEGVKAPGNKADAQYNLLQQNHVELSRIRREISGELHEDLRMTDGNKAFYEKQHFAEEDRRLMRSVLGSAHTIEQNIDLLNTEIRFKEAMGMEITLGSQEFEDILRFELGCDSRHLDDSIVQVFWRSSCKFQAEEPSDNQKRYFETIKRDVGSHWDVQKDGAKTPMAVLDKALSVYSERASQEIERRQRISFDQLQQHAKDIAAFGQKVDTDLKRAGKITAVAAPWNNFKRKANGLFKKIGLGKPLAVEKPLTKAQRTGLKQTASEINEKMQSDSALSRKQKLSLFPMRDKEAKETLEMPQAQVQLALKFINNQTDLSRLHLDSDELASILQKGARARVVGQLTDPLQIEVKEIAGNDAVVVEVTGAQFKGYAEKQARLDREQSQTNRASTSSRTRNN